ncbi:unnamed protein product [Schistosoma margrebowiei]|uniref:Uncharacterized protein n=1 Tax=Schistosoma margrebowiei TaxID=48269 RepID=A0A183LBY9_9TREM|nr:unnamed protein product [Schistosoma margrebowiei]
MKRLIPTALQTTIFNLFIQRELRYLNSSNADKSKSMERSKNERKEKKTLLIKPNSNDLRMFIISQAKNLNNHDIALLDKRLNFNLHRKPLSTLEIVPIMESSIHTITEKRVSFTTSKNIP